jgi:putative transposase
MPRRPCIILPDVPLHLILRGNNRQACIFADEEYLIYLEWLKELQKSALVRFMLMFL